MILKLQSITQEREQTMEHLWKQFQTVLNEYLRHTEEFHNEYIELRQRDDEDTKSIRAHYLEVARATDLIADLRFNLESYRDDQRLHISELTKYKKMLQKKHDQIKCEMDEGLRKDKENLRIMVVCSNQANSVIKTKNL